MCVTTRRRGNAMKKNRWLLWVVFGCTLWPALGIAQIGPQRHYDYYGRTGIAPPMLGSAEGNHLYKGIADLYSGTRNRLEYSVGEFDYILNYIPNHPQALKMMIEAAFRLKRPALALERIEKALALFPGTASTHMICGMFYQRNGQPDKAAEQYIQALRLDNNYVEAQYNLALAYLDLNQPDKANWHAQKVYAMGSKLPGLRTRLEKSGKWNSEVDVNVLPAEIVVAPQKEEPAPAPVSEPAPQKTDAMPIVDKR